MKTIIKSAVAVAAVCLLAGCETTGLSPREQSGVSYPNYILSLQSNGASAPQKLVAPIRLAVAQIGQAAPPETMLDQLAAQKSLVASVAGLPLPAETENNYYHAANYSTGDYGARLKTVCGLAQAAGADYVFLFGGDIDSWRANNSLSILDLTLVGGVLLPGGRTHIEGKGAGALISASTCQPVLFVSADAEDSAASPDYLADGKAANLRARTRDELIRKLTKGLLDKLAGSSVSTKTTN